MHVISRKPFTDAAQKHPNDAEALKDIYKVLRKGTFQSLKSCGASF